MGCSVSTGAINMNRKGFTRFRSVEDIDEEKEMDDHAGFFEKLELMDFKDDLEYK